MPQRLATSATIAPGCIASATIRHFCSSDQLRRRSPRVTTSTTALRVLLCVVVCVLVTSVSASMSASVSQRPTTRPYCRGGSLGGAATTRTSHRHWQALHGSRRGMQRRTQAERDQRHQLDHRREQQLARVLPLPVFLEHHVNPFARKGVLQCNPRHHARRCMPLKLLKDRGPDGPAPVHLCNRGMKNGTAPTP